MSLLKSLASDASIAQETDSVGGNSPLESGLYPFTVAMAHLNKSAGGALGMVLSLKSADNREVRQTLWMTSGTAKGAKNYYEKDGEKHFLPGFNHANALCLLTTGKEVSEMDTESKVIKLYSFEAKAEVPTKVDVLTDLLGKEVLIGLLKQTVDKTAKNDQNIYVPTGETRDENEIDKLFRASDRMTTAEIRAQATEAAFADTWEAKWKGNTRNKAKGAAAGATGTAGAPRAGAAGGAKKPSSSLFA